MLRRINDDAAAGESLAHVIVRVALQREGDALGQECAEALPGRAGELELDGVVRQAVRAVPPRDLSAQHGADGAVHVADGQLEFHRCAVVESFTRVIDELVIERLVEAVVLCSGAAARDAAGNGRAVEDRREVQPARLPVIHGFAHFEAVHAADDFVMVRKPSCAMSSRTSSAT